MLKIWLAAFRGDYFLGIIRKLQSRQIIVKILQIEVLSKLKNQKLIWKFRLKKPIMNSFHNLPKTKNILYKSYPNLKERFPNFEEIYPKFKTKTMKYLKKLWIRKICWIKNLNQSTQLEFVQKLWFNQSLKAISQLTFRPYNGRS